MFGLLPDSMLKGMRGTQDGGPRSGFSTRWQNVRHGPRICSTYSRALLQRKQWTAEAATCRAFSVAGHSCPKTLPKEAQLGAVVVQLFPPRLRCQRLGGIVVARQVQKAEAWLYSASSVGSLNSRQDPAVPVGVDFWVAEDILLELHNDERDLGLHHLLRLDVLVDPPSY